MAIELSTSPGSLILIAAQAAATLSNSPLQSSVSSVMVQPQTPMVMLAMRSGMQVASRFMPICSSKLTGVFAHSHRPASLHAAFGCKIAPGEFHVCYYALDRRLNLNCRSCLQPLGTMFERMDRATLPFFVVIGILELHVKLFCFVVRSCRVAQGRCTRPSCSGRARLRQICRPSLSQT